MISIATPWIGARIISFTVCVMAAAALLFAWFAPVDIVVSAQGRIIPSGKSKTIQSLEPGLVKAIAVRDGQAVRAGDVLLELDSRTTSAERDRLQRDVWELEGDVVRLQATLSGSPSLLFAPDVPGDMQAIQRSLLAERRAEQQTRIAGMQSDLDRKSADGEAISANLDQLRNSLPLVAQKHAMRQELAKTGYIAQTGLIETKLELISATKEIAVQESRLRESQAAVATTRHQMEQARAEFRSRASTDLMEATRKRDAARQDLIKATQRSDLQTLRSPIDGVVQQLAVTTLGGVVTQAQPLMTIVPADSALEVEAQVLNRDIGHVHVGQRVVNKIETFDFTRYGFIEGTVLWVGTDAVVDQKLGQVYPVRIRLAKTETPNEVDGHAGMASAGMNVTADIRSGQRRMLEYFLAPMLRYKQEALRER